MPVQERNLLDELVDIEFSPEDAVLIMEAVLENGFRILPVCMWKHKLELEEVEDVSSLPESVQDEIMDEVLDEVLNVDTVNDFVKSRVRWVQKIRSAFARAEADIEPAALNQMRERADEVTQAIESEGGIAQLGIPDTITKLRKLRREGKFRKEGPDLGILRNDEANDAIDQVVEVITEILDEGQKNIFWPGRYEIHRFISARSGPSLQEANGGRGLGSTIWAGVKTAFGAGAGAAATGAKAGSFGGLKGAAIIGAGGFVAGATMETISQLRRNFKKN